MRSRQSAVPCKIMYNMQDPALLFHQLDWPLNLTEFSLICDYVRLGTL